MPGRTSLRLNAGERDDSLRGHTLSGPEERRKKATVGESTLKIFTRFSCIFNSPVPKQIYPPKGRINTYPNGFETTTGQGSLSLAQRLASGIQKGTGRELHKDLQNSQCNITKTKTEGKWGLKGTTQYYSQP